ncbi:HD-GYP domain-containing protein [Clostridium aminobutyricum]|uniref:HD domain-containing protein n=1 Tax=Clostridium aminobutyricum TaxID=33953 RepID=A0A939IG11_CLOAM|nr:HD domain-containing phosphohydrolase [Clostridium aminobutyricum]MBN7772360.1 HD domain-containing protein [Clostridium aminobutyricum]
MKEKNFIFKNSGRVRKYIHDKINPIDTLNSALELEELPTLTKDLDMDMLNIIVLKKTIELIATRDITIHALIGLLEVRDIESSNHTIRTQKMMETLCGHLRTKELYKQQLTRSYIDELVATTPLHDIGKVGIPDKILLKPAKLTADEFELMKKHVNYGVEALKNESYCEDDMPSFIKTAIEIVSAHHERYDGTGYPLGLSGEAIPLPGRLMAIIDVYDALMSKRVYKPAYEHKDTIEIIKSQIGRHFDPHIVNGFLEIEEKIYQIWCQYLKETPSS